MKNVHVSVHVVQCIREHLQSLKSAVQVTLAWTATAAGHINPQGTGMENRHYMVLCEDRCLGKYSP